MADINPDPATAPANSEAKPEMTIEVNSCSDMEKQTDVSDESRRPSDMEHTITSIIETKTMTWWQASLVMVAETVSLGILSLPASVAALGFLDGGILILALGAISAYTGFAMYQFKMAHPHVESFADAGLIVGGRVGKWIGDFTVMLLLIFVMAAHVLTFSVMMNALTEHATCTIVFSVIGLVVCLIFTLPRTLRTSSYFSIFSCLSILIAAFTALISTALRNPIHPAIHSLYPASLTNIATGSLAVSNIILSFTGHAAYFNIIAEMRRPTDFPLALTVCQSSTTVLYLIVGIVIYFYAGLDVTSPALNSAGPLVAKIAFGIACPTIIVAGVIPGMIAAKTVYARVWRRKPQVVCEKSARAWASWVGVVVALWVLAWLIANVIPVFSQLIAVIGAVFGTWISLGFPSIFWFNLNWKRGGNTSRWIERFKASYALGWRKVGLTALNVVIFVIGLVLCVAGLYGSALAISQNPPQRRPFSCANNA